MLFTQTPIEGHIEFRKGYLQAQAERNRYLSDAEAFDAVPDLVAYKLRLEGKQAAKDEIPGLDDLEWKTMPDEWQQGYLYRHGELAIYDAKRSKVFKTDKPQVWRQGYLRAHGGSTMHLNLPFDLSDDADWQRGYRRAQQAGAYKQGLALTLDFDDDLSADAQRQGLEAIKKGMGFDAHAPPGWRKSYLQATGAQAKRQGLPFDLSEDSDWRKGYRRARGKSYAFKRLPFEEGAHPDWQTGYLRAQGRIAAQEGLPFEEGAHPDWQTGYRRAKGWRSYYQRIRKQKDEKAIAGNPQG